MDVHREEGQHLTDFSNTSLVSEDRSVIRSAEGGKSSRKTGVMVNGAEEKQSSPRIQKPGATATRLQFENIQGQLEVNLVNLSPLAIVQFSSFVKNFL